MFDSEHKVDQYNFGSIVETNDRNTVIEDIENPLMFSQNSHQTPGSPDQYSVPILQRDDKERSSKRGSKRKPPRTMRKKGDRGLEQSSCCAGPDGKQCNIF